MLTELAAECAHHDPVLVVPWAAAPEEQGATLGRRFVDLREDPWALDEIPEAEQHPALLGALRALNAPRSPVWTAKCDAWPLAPDELDSTRAELLLEPEDASHGFASYLDLLARDRAVFTSFHATEALSRRLLRLADPLEYPRASLRAVLRPAVVDLGAAQEGYAVTLYLSSLGYSAADSYGLWEAALAAVVQLLRSRELRGAASAR